MTQRRLVDMAAGWRPSASLRPPRSPATASGRAGFRSVLQQTADDAALPRVQVVLPKEGPPTQALTLPGEVKAWNEAAIYGQVSGYVSQWFKDNGAHVNAGDLLATIATPSLDAELASSKANWRRRRPITTSPR